MPKCTISTAFTTSTHELVDTIRPQVEEAGGRFEGDTTAGNIVLTMSLFTIEAMYTIIGQQLTVFVQKKPLIVSCKQIEDFLREQIAVTPDKN
ncbi:MAG TPA: hypothetical protein VGN63_18805 [Flavisolibacter sp.]|jgi:hypothetical protein|nr:hypothetical protein [Flavisolibacter sp.]